MKSSVLLRITHKGGAELEIGPKCIVLPGRAKPSLSPRSTDVIPQFLKN